MAWSQAVCSQTAVVTLYCWVPFVGAGVGLVARGLFSNGSGHFVLLGAVRWGRCCAGGSVLLTYGFAQVGRDGGGFRARAELGLTISLGSNLTFTVL